MSWHGYPAANPYPMHRSKLSTGCRWTDGVEGLGPAMLGVVSPDLYRDTRPTREAGHLRHPPDVGAALEGVSSVAMFATMLRRDRTPHGCQGQ